MDTWNPPVIEAAGPALRVVVFDPRGTGYSGYTDEPFSILLFMQDTARLMEGLGITGRTCSAFPWGPHCAELALAFPEK